MLRAGNQVGRGGWTWYTGSASWMYRAWIEEVLGFHKRDNQLTIEPSIPTDWSGFTLRYRHASTQYHIEVQNPDGVERGVLWLELDGKRLRTKVLPLVDDGIEHRVVGAWAWRRRRLMAECEESRRPLRRRMVKENSRIDCGREQRASTHMSTRSCFSLCIRARLLLQCLAKRCTVSATMTTKRMADDKACQIAGWLHSTAPGARAFDDVSHRVIFEGGEGWRQQFLGACECSTETETPE
jgi:hypothetical protein